jgi:hypothetical protein
MRKTWLLFILILSIPSLAGAAVIEAVMPPFQETLAYKQYQKRPKSELSKILYLMDRFKKTSLKVIYDRVEYESDVALKHAKSYVAKHYKRENAAVWIREHAYRSTSGTVIYVKYPDGEKKLLRDILIEELKNIEA